MLLKEVGDRLRTMGYKIQNIDSTIVAQAPKLADYIPQMTKNIAGVLDIHAELVNVKATTEEHLGFTGSGDGIAAHAVALIV